MRGLGVLLFLLLLILGGLAAIVQWPNAVPGGPMIAAKVTEIAMQLGLPWPRDLNKAEGEKLWHDYNSMKSRSTNGSDVAVLEGAVDRLQKYADTSRGSQDADMIDTLGQAVVELGQRQKDIDLTKAIQSFSRAYALDKTNSAALEGRAWSHHDRAVKVREGSIPALPNLQPDDDLREAVADFSLALQVALDAQRAVQAAGDKPVSIDEKDVLQHQKAEAARLPDIYVGRGRAYLGQGRYDEASADFSEAIRIAPTSVQAYLWRGVAQGRKAYANNDKAGYSSAYSDFSQALSQADDNQKAEVLLYRSQTRRDDQSQSATYKTAMTDLDDAKKLAPSRADVHYEASLTAHQIVQALDQSRGAYNSCRSGKARDYCKQDSASAQDVRKGLKETAKNEAQQARDLEPTNKKYNDQFALSVAGAATP